MAITFGTPTTATVSPLNAAEVVVNAPADLVDGCHLLLVSAYGRNSSSSTPITGPASFTDILSNGTLATRRAAAFLKYVPDASAEPATYTMSGPGSSSWAAIAIRVNGLPSTSFFQAVSDPVGFQATSFDFPSVTATAAPGYYFGVAGIRKPGSEAVTCAGLTEIASVGTADGTWSNECSVSIHGKAISATGGSGAESATIPGSDQGFVFGFIVTEAAASPTISSVTPSTLAAASNPVIAGTNFEASQGTGVVTLSPTDNVADAAAVTQAIAASGWSDTEITLDGVSFPAGTSHNDTLYLFVTNDTGESNAAGEAVTAYIAPTLTSPTAVSIGTTTVTPRVTTDTGNGTCYYVITPQAEGEPSNTQVEAGTNAADGVPVASGSTVVSGTPPVVVTFPEVTGLTAGTAYRISYAHSGTPS